MFFCKLFLALKLWEILKMQDESLIFLKHKPKPRPGLHASGLGISLSLGLGFELAEVRYFSP